VVLEKERVGDANKRVGTVFKLMLKLKHTDINSDDNTVAC